MCLCQGSHATCPREGGSGCVPVWERACTRTCVPNATPSLQLPEKDMHTEGSSHGKAERGENSGRTCPFLCRKWRRDTQHRQPSCPVKQASKQGFCPLQIFRIITGIRGKKRRQAALCGCTIALLKPVKRRQYHPDSNVRAVANPAT